MTISSYNEDERKITRRKHESRFDRQWTKSKKTPKSKRPHKKQHKTVCYNCGKIYIDFSYTCRFCDK